MWRYFIVLFLLVGCHALPSDRSAADVNIALGMHYLNQQAWDLANQYFQQAKKAAPDYSAVSDSLAQYENSLGHFNEAEQYYRLAIRQALSPAVEHNNYGVFLCRKQEYPKALQQFKLALEDKHYVHSEMAKNNKRICELKSHQRKY